MPSVLNVGGGKRDFLLPPLYDGWRQDLLDIDPAVAPDIVMDARELTRLPAGTYDAVYCAHNLEHYHRHDGLKVLRGFFHLLKQDGFAEIHVPDMAFVFREIAEKNLDIDDVIYESRGGPLLVRDVIYGYHVEIERSGQDFYAHKTGFTRKSLKQFVCPQVFANYLVYNADLAELVAFFFKQPPSKELYDAISARFAP